MNFRVRFILQPAASIFKDGHDARGRAVGVGERHGQSGEQEGLSRGQRVEAAQVFYYERARAEQRFVYRAFLAFDAVRGYSVEAEAAYAERERVLRGFA